MNGVTRTLVGVALLAMVVSTAVASPITVNGDDADWTSPLTTYNDPNGDVENPDYDIDFIYSDFDQAADRLAFMTRTISIMPQTADADHVVYIFNADDNTGTGDPSFQGCAGADYRIDWDLDAPANTVVGATPLVPPFPPLGPLDFYQWNGGSWVGVDLPSSAIQIAWGNEGAGPDYSVIECTIDPTIIGSPDTFVWGCYLDNGGTSADDYAQDRIDGGDDSPEPATWVLIACTVAVGALRRRRG